MELAQIGVFVPLSYAFCACACYRAELWVVCTIGCGTGRQGRFDDIADLIINPLKVPRLGMVGLIPRSTRNAVRAKTGVMLFGAELRDHREELFVAMVCDGLALGLAFKRAGFTSKAHDAPSNLWALPRLQDRAQAILRARATTGVVSLGDVTSMLQRVFAGANAAEEYSAAHNAALSLARIYGHVTDRASIEVIRRPSRDPDAPSEAALEAWAASLPVVSGPGLEASPAVLGPLRGAPAAPLGPEPGPETAGPEPSMHVNVHSEFSNDINGLREFRTLTCTGPGLEARGPAGGRPENGAPARPVTGTPQPGGPADLLGPEPKPGGHSAPPEPGPLSEKGAPLPEDEGTRYPSAEDLF